MSLATEIKVFEVETTPKEDVETLFKGSIGETGSDSKIIPKEETNFELLTIVIPTRNRPHLLKRCLRSVFERQSVVPKVIVSDNSIWDQPAIKTWQAEYGFAYVRQTGQLNMSEHFNVCLKLSSTRWMLMLHDDDELAPGSLAKLESLLRDCRDVGVVIAGVRYTHRRGHRWKWIPQSGTFRGEAGLVRLGLDWGAAPSATIFRVAASREIGGFIGINGIAADYTFALQLAYRYGVTFFPELLAFYHYGHEQESDISTRQRAEAYVDYTIQMAELVRTVGCSPEIGEQIVEYKTWQAFLYVAQSWFRFHPRFTFKLCQKCLRRSPRNGEWQNRVRLRYPFLFCNPKVAWFLYSWELLKLVRAGLQARLWRWWSATIPVLPRLIGLSHARRPMGPV